MFLLDLGDEWLADGWALVDFVEQALEGCLLSRGFENASRFGLLVFAPAALSCRFL
jgi:hypothetical protein